MTGTRAWTVGAALVAVLLFVAGWFLLVSPKRSDAAALRVQAAKLDQDNATARANINRLKALAAELPAQQANLAAVRGHIPDNPELPSLIRSLTDLAAKSGVVIKDMTPGTPSSVVAKKVGVQPTVPSGTAQPASGSAPTAGATAGQPVSTLQAIPVQLGLRGSYFAIEQFLNRLEDQQRSFIVTSLDLKGDSAAASSSTISTSGQADPLAAKPGDLQVSLGGRVYLAPTITTPANPTVPKTPATTGTPAS